MRLFILLQGITMGFSIAAPLGPIGILCINRALQQGLKAGFFTGLGAATADALYGSLLGFSFTFVTQWLTEQQIWLHGIGGVLLCYLAITTFRTPPMRVAKLEQKYSLWHAYLTTFFLTLTNPMTILVFIGIFANFTQDNFNAQSAFALICGVFLGSAAWWLILSTTVSFTRQIMPGYLQSINRLSSMILMGYGIHTMTVIFH